MAKKQKQEEIPLLILTNERTPMKAQQLLMLYKAAALGQLGYMDGMDPDTGEIVPVIVGLEPTADGKFNVFPLARIFNKVDGIPQYLVPDGTGNYLDYRLPELGNSTSGSDSGTDSGGSAEASSVVEAWEEDRTSEEG